MQKNIVWLASYPKSGNTWTRIFLANYLLNLSSPVDINKVQKLGVSDAVRRLYENVAQRKLPVDEYALTLSLRTNFLKKLASNKADVNLVKSHSICSQAMGVTLIPEQVTRAAIYIIRNPLDMVLSYAKHFGLTVEQAAEAIGRSDNASPGDEHMAPQYFGKWSEHVDSWTAKHPYPVAVLQYEKMLTEPKTEFAKALDLLGVPVEEERLEKAIRFSSFKEVSKQEEERGFVENSEKQERFFGRGESGYWKDELDPAIVKRIRSDHKAQLKKYGYW